MELVFGSVDIVDEVHDKLEEGSLVEGDGFMFMPFGKYDQNTLTNFFKELVFIDIFNSFQENYNQFRNRINIR